MQEHFRYGNSFQADGKLMTSSLVAARGHIGADTMKPLLSKEELSMLLGGLNCLGQDADTGPRGKMPLVECLTALFGLSSLTMVKIAALMVFLPLAWIFLLIHLFGVVPSVVLLVLCGVSGAFLVHRAGLGGFRAINEAMLQGQAIRDQEMKDFLLLLSGICLLIPGPVTGVAGLSMLIPATRESWAGSLHRCMSRWIRDHEPACTYP